MPEAVRNSPSKCPTKPTMTRAKSMSGNTLRRNHLLDGFSWFGRNLEVLSYPGVARVTSSKKGVSPSTYLARRWPVTL